MKSIATAESLPLEETVIGTETVIETAIKTKKEIGIEIVIVTAETRRTNATSAQSKLIARAVRTNVHIRKTSPGRKATRRNLAAKSAKATKNVKMTKIVRRRRTIVRRIKIQWRTKRLIATKKMIAE